MLYSIGTPDSIQNELILLKDIFPDICKCRHISPKYFL